VWCRLADRLSSRTLCVCVCVCVYVCVVCVVSDRSVQLAAHSLYSLYSLLRVAGG
jgi:hypothetical protein